MFTEADVHSLIPGEIVHGDDRCEAYTVTSVKAAKNHPDHFEAWAVSRSGVLVIRFTCNNDPGFHRAADHDRVPKARPKRIKVATPPVRRKVRRTKRAA